MTSTTTITGPTSPDHECRRITACIAEGFESAGEELYLVGGAVRDRLLGRPHFDLDFSTSSLPARSVHILESLGFSNPYRVGEKFGTIGLRLGDRVIEITTYRSAETYTPGSRKPEVIFGKTILEDLSRRDFTINAMAEHPLTHELVDPLGGLSDLQSGIIRAVGLASDRFREDPLRILRAVRFAGRLNFTIEAHLWTSIQLLKSSLMTISRERIRDEYSKILLDSNCQLGLTLLRDTGLFENTVPELLELTRMPDHGPRHPLSLWDHTLRVVNGVQSDLELRWAALLHDIAKPTTRTHEPSGRPRFFHHEEIGARMARSILTGLRYPNSMVDTVCLLVEAHMQLHAYSPEWTDGAVRRLLLRMGSAMPRALQLVRADAAGHTLSGISENAPKFDALERRILSLQSEPLETLKSPLSGQDLMNHYQRPPGPWIREVKNVLCNEVIEGRLSASDRDQAWKIADRVVSDLA